MCDPLGDWNTDRITLTTPSGYRLWITGFVYMDDELPDKTDGDVEFVELKDGLDSSGGLNSDAPEDIQFYADVRKRLTDFTLIDAHEDKIGFQYRSEMMAEDLDKALDEYSLEELEEMKEAFEEKIEEKGKERSSRRPEPVDDPDLSGVVKRTEQYLDQLEETGRPDTDLPHYIFERVMNALYGDNIDDFWEWHNSMHV